MKRTQHSKVTTIANRLVKQGYNRANAMVKEWVLVKLPNICTKVAGVASMLGHAQLKTTNRYVHAVEQAEKEAANTFETLLNTNRKSA